MNKYNVGKVFENGPFRCKIRAAAPGGNYLADCRTSDDGYPQVMRFDEETIDEIISGANGETDVSYGGKNRHVGKRRKSKGRKRRTNKKRKTKGRKRL